MNRNFVSGQKLDLSPLFGECKLQANSAGVYHPHAKHEQVQILEENKSSANKHRFFRLLFALVARWIATSWLATSNASLLLFVDWTDRFVSLLGGPQLKSVSFGCLLEGSLQSSFRVLALEKCIFPLTVEDMISSAEGPNLSRLAYSSSLAFCRGRAANVGSASHL